MSSGWNDKIVTKYKNPPAHLNTYLQLTLNPTWQYNSMQRQMTNSEGPIQQFGSSMSLVLISHNTSTRYILEQREWLVLPMYMPLALGPGNNHAWWSGLIMIFWMIWFCRTLRYIRITSVVWTRWKWRELHPQRRKKRKERKYAHAREVQIQRLRKKRKGLGERGSSILQPHTSMH